VTNRSNARLSRFFGAGRRSGPPFPLRSVSKSAGFALVAVIWTLGLITLLGMAVIVGARYRTKVASSYASVLAAGTAAESAINLAIATALTRPGEQKVKFPLRCRMPGGERVIVTIEEETGKVDLNTATAAVLARFFTALSRDQSMGARLAARVAEFRDRRSDQSKGRNAPPASDVPEPRFTTIMQLDQVDGIPPQIFREALRFVTVRSGRPEPDADAASPALRRLLNLGEKQPAPTRGLPIGGNVTIRADVSAPDGARFIREALVSLASDNGRPFVVREWRRGDIESKPTTSTTSRDGARVPESGCIRPGEAMAS
jgi:general secretion pathway protein K